MKTLDLWMFASIESFIWLFGAFTFRFGGHLMSESGSLVVAISAVSIALSVRVLLSTVVSWRTIISQTMVPWAEKADSPQSCRTDGRPPRSRR
jgi:hypothetical protein